MDSGGCQCDPESEGCEVTCVNYPGLYECSCNDGYFLEASTCKGILFYHNTYGSVTHSSCIDFDECSDLDIGGCQCDLELVDCTARCNNIAGSHYCSCNEGYSMDLDDVTCIGELHYTVCMITEG